MKHLSEIANQQRFEALKKRWAEMDRLEEEQQKQVVNPTIQKLPTSLLIKDGYQQINAELERYIYNQIIRNEGFAYQFKGNAGNGKTELSKAVYRTVLAVHKINTPIFAATTSLWERYKYLVKGNFEDAGEQIRAIKEAMDMTTCYFLDELGGEQPNFKTQGINKAASDFVTGILMNLYDRICNSSPFYCIITTNLSQEDLRQLYGERIFDRVIGRFQEVNFTGKSFRKLQQKIPLEV